MELHIGREIEAKYHQSGIKLSEFAKRLNTGPRNVYSIFERKDISSVQLQKISQILNFNFFELYARGLTSAPTTNGPTNNEAKPNTVTISVCLDGTQKTLDRWIALLTAFNASIN